MIVSKLIEELSKLPQEKKVFLYIDEAEEWGNVSKASVYKEEDDLPYGKGDEPDIEDGGIVVIEGGII